MMQPSAEHGTIDGFRWGVVRAPTGAIVLRLVPPLRAAVSHVLVALVWIVASSMLLASLVRASRSFLFVPIVLFPVRRYDRDLCSRVNRVGFSVDPDRFTFRQGPLPRGEPLERATCDLRVVREVEIDEVPGGWLAQPRRSWTLRVVERDGAATVLPLSLPSAELARVAAAHLMQALDDVRTPIGYRR